MNFAHQDLTNEPASTARHGNCSLCKHTFASMQAAVNHFSLAISFGKTPELGEEDAEQLMGLLQDNEPTTEVEDMEIDDNTDNDSVEDM